MSNLVTQHSALFQGKSCLTFANQSRFVKGVLSNQKSLTSGYMGAVQNLALCHKSKISKTQAFAMGQR